MRSMVFIWEFQKKKKKKKPNCLGVSELRSLLVGLLSADVEHDDSLPSLG